MKKIEFTKIYKNNCKYIIIIFIVSLIYSFFLTFPLTILRKFIEDASLKNTFNKDDLLNLIIIASSYLFCQLLSNILINFQKMYFSRTQFHLSHKLRMNIYNHLLELYQDFFDNNDISDIVNKMIHDSDIVFEGFLSSIGNFSRALFSFSFGIYFMWKISPIITIIVFPFAVFAGVITRIISEKYRIYARDNRRKNAIMWKTTQENLRGIRDIHALNMERQSFKTVENASNQMKLNLTNTAKFSFKVNLINNLSFFVITCLMMIIGTYLITKNLITVGAVIAMIMYNNILTTPVQEIISTVQDVSKIKISIERINEILVVEKDTNDNYNLKEETIESGNEVLVEFKNITYAYPNKAFNVLNNLSFEIKKGKKYAFVGKTGSGKTTILKLCLGIYKYNIGTIKIFNKNIQNNDKFLIRQKMGFVFQETFLYNTTILENILFSNEKISKEQLAKIMKITHVDEIIESLPSGLETIVGENGVQLSGGQKQRIGLARALLKKPEILLLDEATSALDNNTEKKVMSNLIKNYPDLTIICIAHRLSTIEKFDVIFYLEKGSIIESGNNEELLEKNGKYKELYYAYKKQIRKL